MTWRWLGFITASIAFFINLLRAAVTAGSPDTPHRLDPRVKVQLATLAARRRLLAGEEQEQPLSFLLVCFRGRVCCWLNSNGDSSRHSSELTSHSAHYNVAVELGHCERWAQPPHPIDVSKNIVPFHIILSLL